jgi:hypothetical protein
LQIDSLRVAGAHQIPPTHEPVNDFSQQSQRDQGQPFAG